MRFFSATFAALALAAFTHAAAQSPAAITERTGHPSLTGDDVIPFFDLPTLVSTGKSKGDPRTIEDIRTALALYPLAIDGKNFDALSRIFARDAVANYSPPLNILKPLSTIQSVLKSSLKPVTTQHSFGTQLIEVLSHDTAFSVTYYTATHFGKGPFTGKIATAFGQYQDVWKKQRDGKWKITHRNLVYMGPLIGDQIIFTYVE